MKTIHKIKKQMNHFFSHAGFISYSMEKKVLLVFAFQFFFVKG